MINIWKPNLYNDKHSFVFQYGEDLVEMLCPGSEERILDLGCGSGQLTSIISQRAKTVVGLDQSPEMIADAQSKYGSIEFQIGNASDFWFDEPFDAIFSNAALHWVKDYREAIKCMYRCLKPGGRLVAEFGGKGNVEVIISTLRKSLRKRGFMAQAQVNPWFFPSIGEYTSVLESEGFEVSYAQLYDRPTELADEESGIRDWLSMFASQFFDNMDEKTAEEIKSEVQDNLRSECFLNGKWIADYRRIRIIACSNHN